VKRSGEIEMERLICLLLLLCTCHLTSAGRGPSLVEQSALLEARLAKVETWFRERRVTTCGAGLQDYRIVDDELSESSSVNADHNYRGARLLNTHQPVPAWCALTADQHKWIQVDMQVEKPVHGIVVQGRENSDQWTTVFQVLYKSNESDSFKYVLDENNNPESFAGNVDRNTPHTADFLAPVTARFIRVKIREWHGHPCMRFEILTC